MDMQAKPQDQLIFHLTGRRQGDGLAPIEGLDLRPALLAPYRDLAALRHDFPIVLDERLGGPEFVRTLSGVVDVVLKDVAPRGIEGERLRRHALQLEAEIRRAVDAGAGGALTELWAIAAAQLGAREGETLEQVLGHAGGALRTDGEVLGCTPDMPARLITHAWKAARHAKARRFHADLSRLVLKLSDILRAAFSHSQASRQPHHLKASVGGPHQDQFDFTALSARACPAMNCRRLDTADWCTRWVCSSRSASSPRPTTRVAASASTSCSTTAPRPRRPGAIAWRS
jgi:hypothetical protein